MIEVHLLVALECASRVRVTELDIGALVELNRVLDRLGEVCPRLVLRGERLLKLAYDLGLWSAQRLL